MVSARSGLPVLSHMQHGTVDKKQDIKQEKELEGKLHMKLNMKENG